MPIQTGQQILAADVVALRLVGMMSASHQAAGVGAWEDWDLSAVVPAGTTVVLVVIWAFNGTGINRNFGARKNGSADNRYFIVTQNSNDTFFLLTDCDANRIIEIYDGNDVVGSLFYIAGYIK